MSKKKFVATLLHACTLYCVSAYQVQGSDIAGSMFRSFPDQVAANYSGDDNSLTGRRDNGAFSVRHSSGSDFSSAIRLFKARTGVKRGLFSSEYLFPYLPLPVISDNWLPVARREPHPAGVCHLNLPVYFVPDACSEGNATWIEYCLTTGP